MDLSILPDHVLIIIFQSLDNFDLLVCRAVCKRWLRLIRSKKYFTRVHRLKFSECILSSSCPPLSVFRTCDEPFFRYLTISGVKIKKNEDISEWEQCWRQIGQHITHLVLGPFDKFSAKVDPAVVLGNGADWSELVDLDINDFQYTLSPELKIPSVIKLKLCLGLVRQINECDFQQSFPNVRKVYVDGYFEGFNQWITERLSGVWCWSHQLNDIHSNQIEKVGLMIDDFIHANRLEAVQPFLQKHKGVVDFSVNCSLMKVPEWSQITELYMDFPEPFDGHYPYLLRDCLAKLCNLKSLTVQQNDTPFSDDHICFFGHQPVELPKLKFVSLRVSGRRSCEVCWECCMKSFKAAKSVEMHFTEFGCKYAHLMTNLESLSFLEHILSAAFVHEGDYWIFSKVPSLLNLDCSFVRLGDEAYSNSLESFPNLRTFEVARFRPSTLENFKQLEQLTISFINPEDSQEYDSVDGNVKLIDTICRLGKNLRVLEIEGITGINVKLFAKLFEELPLLLKVKYEAKVFTRHIMEKFDIEHVKELNFEMFVYTERT